MIREVCSCGAEFETDEQNSVRLVKDWRANHRHETSTPQRDTTIEATLGFQAELSSKELHRTSHEYPWEDKKE